MNTRISIKFINDRLRTLFNNFKCLDGARYHFISYNEKTGSHNFSI